MDDTMILSVDNACGSRESNIGELVRNVEEFNVPRYLKTKWRTSHRTRHYVDARKTLLPMCFKFTLDYPRLGACMKCMRCKHACKSLDPG
jgi:hypothetical protein